MRPRPGEPGGRLGSRQGCPDPLPLAGLPDQGVSCQAVVPQNAVGIPVGVDPHEGARNPAGLRARSVAPEPLIQLRHGRVQGSEEVPAWGDRL
jgi:hypothetical protein